MDRVNKVDMVYRVDRGNRVCRVERVDRVYRVDRGNRVYRGLDIGFSCKLFA